jgi:hypothetical protein
MKNKFLILTAALTIAISAMAVDLTTDNMTSKEYLRSRGYSSTMADAVYTNKMQINGEYQQRSRYDEHPKFDKFIRNFYNYIDPSQESDSFLNHDVKMTPQYDDL